MKLIFNVCFSILFLFDSDAHCDVGDSSGFSSDILYEDYRKLDEYLSDSDDTESDDSDDWGEGFNNDNDEDETEENELEGMKIDPNYYKEFVKSKDHSVPSMSKSILDMGNYLFNDLMLDSLLIPSYKLSGEWQDTINHHVIDPVRKGKHYLRYMDSVMLGTFDNMIKESTDSASTPFHFLWGIVFKNVISDFKLGSEVRSPGIIDSKYHNHPVLVRRLGAESRKIAKKMEGTHEHELVVIDVVKPFMLAFDIEEDYDEIEDEIIDEYEIEDEDRVADEYEMVNQYEDRKRRVQNRKQSSPIALLYKFYYATKKLVAGVNSAVEFEDTEYFKQTGRYEESDRTFLFHWNKTLSKRSSFRSGQIVRVDRKGFFSMGPIPLAWNYCEVILHEGGTKNKKVLVQRHEKEIFYEHKEIGAWGIRKEGMEPVERTRTVRKKVVKQVPNINKFRVYTENLCKAAEASVRSKSEVIAFTSQRTFSWFVPALAFIGGPSISYLLSSPQNGHFYHLTPALIAGVFLTSWFYPSWWDSEIPNTIHSIKFPPPDEYL